MLENVLSNVLPGTASTLAYMMLGLISFSLVAGPVLVYYYWNRLRRSKATEAPAQAPH